MKNTNLQIEASGEQKSEVSKNDVVLALSSDWKWRPYMVMPLDNRRTEFFNSLIVARIAAKSMADQSHGKVIVKIRK